MLEIFKAKKTLPRSLVEKLLCFDRVKEYCSDNQISGLSNTLVKSLIQKTHETLDQFKPRTQIKISQQATEANDDLLRLNSTTENSITNLETRDISATIA